MDIEYRKKVVPNNDDWAVEAHGLVKILQYSQNEILDLLVIKKVILCLKQVNVN